MPETSFDLIVIGGGPGGYTAALRAAQLGLKTACVEREDALGGTCARIGCIPSKALLESSELFSQAKSSLGRHGIVAVEVALDLAAMQKRKDDLVGANTRGIEYLFKKAGVTRVFGHGRLVGAGQVAVEAGPAKSGSASGGAARTLTAKYILLATGSMVARLPNIEVNGVEIGTSTEALNYSEIPKHLVVLGAGAIGLELGSVWNRLGAKVTVLERMVRILSDADLEIANEAQKILARQGLEFKLGVKVLSARIENGGVVVECEGVEHIACDKVLVSVGRIANTENLGLDAVGIRVDGKGRIPVDEGYVTSSPGIYAIGDVIPGAMLAHKAEAEGVACVEKIVTGYGRVNYGAIPNVVYTQPEIAGVGSTEEELKNRNVPYKKSSFPFQANGRARILGHTEGRVKMLAHAETDRVLGVHIVGPRAGDLIAEAVAAIEFGASSEDVASCCHAHPTLSEALKEAALGVAGRAINL